MKVVAIASLKGGVGKSTTALFVAEHWALAGLRVLVIDLDPQSNSSFMLLSREGLLDLEKAEKTLPHFFRDVRAGRDWRSFHYIVPRGSDLKELHDQARKGYVSVLPSLPVMWFEEYGFDRECFASGVDPVQARLAALRMFLASESDNFDCVLLDCPPGFGSLARAGILLADEIVAPTIADYVSTRSLADFFSYGLSSLRGTADCGDVHIAISKFTGTNFQKRVLDILIKEYPRTLPPIGFKDDVLQATEVFHGTRRTYRQKYPGTICADVQKMCSTLLERIVGAHSKTGAKRS